MSGDTVLEKQVLSDAPLGSYPDSCREPYVRLREISRITPYALAAVLIPPGFPSLPAALPPTREFQRPCGAVALCASRKPVWAQRPSCQRRVPDARSVIPGGRLPGCARTGDARPNRVRRARPGLPARGLLAASRANGARSRGSSTAAGKAVSACAGLRHGLYSAAAVLPTESHPGYVALREKFLADLHPRTPRESALVEQLVSALWCLRRARVAESEIVTACVRELFPGACGYTNESRKLKNGDTSRQHIENTTPETALGTLNPANPSRPIGRPARCGDRWFCAAR